METKKQYQFTTLEDVVKHEPFIDSINVILDRIREQYESRPILDPDKRYKVGLFDRLKENGMLSGQRIADQVLLIEGKTSTLPMQVRNDLKLIYTTALVEFLKENLPIQTGQHLPD